MSQEGAQSLPSASPCSPPNPFSPGAVSPLQAREEAAAGSAERPQVFQVHTPPNEQTPLSVPTQPFAVPSDFTSVVMMMAQTLQAVQAQTQAMTQLATVISQQQQQSLQQQQQPQPQPQATAPLAPSVSGTQSEKKADSAGKLDLKWLPAMPLPAWKTWKDRITEIHEYGVWLETFTSWVSVLHSSFGPEIQEAVTRGPMASPLTHDIMTVEQIQRSQRVLHLLKQAFAGFGRVESIAGLLESVGGMQRASGYELLRRITEEFSLQSRNEALHYRNQLLSYQVPHGTNLLETVRLVEVAVNKYHRMLGVSMPDLRVLEADMYLLYLKNVPEEVKTYVQLHARNETVRGVKEAIETYYIRTRVIGDTAVCREGLHNMGNREGKGKGGIPCGICGRTGHVAENCWDAKPGKGKGKKGKEGKGKSKKGAGSSPQTTRSGDSKAGRECWNCGEQGHLAHECKKPKQENKGKGKKGKKGKQRSLTQEDKESEAEPEGEVVMLLRAGEHRLSAMAERTGARIAGVCSVKGQVETWLVDSGATSHVMTREALRRYEVVRVHSTFPKLWSAAEEQIPTYGLVDLRVQFGKSRFVVTDVIVAEVSFCVLSSFALAQHDWVTHLSKRAASLTRAPAKGQIRQKVPLKMENRAWWAMAQLKEKVPEHPDLPALLSEIGRARSEKMEVDGAIKTVATVTVCPKAQGKTDAHDPKLVENAHRANPQHEVVRASEAKKPPKINASESAAVKSILRRSNTCLDTSVPFHYMLRVLRSDLNAATSLQVEPCSSQHDVHEIGSVLEQTNVSECASAAVFQPPLTSNPTLNNTSLAVDELTEADMFCSRHLFSQTCEFEPMSQIEKPCRENMFLSDSSSELEEPFSCTQQFSSHEDCSNSMFEKFSLSQAENTVLQPDMSCQTNRTVDRMLELSQTEPMHNMDVVLLAKAKDMSGCSSLSHTVQGLGSLESMPQGKTTAWLRGLKEASLDRRPVDQLHGLPQVVEVEPQSSPKLPEPSTASDSRGLERPSGGSAEAEGLPPEDLFEDDVDLEGKALDARGHFPFMRECVECRECKGMIPARSRRSKAAEDHLGVAADFVFSGRFVRIALFLALGTGMICAFRVEKSEAFNITQTVLAFKELGGTGRSVEFLSDCDDYLIKLVREASKRETFGSKGVNFRPAPVGRPQYKGRIERMVRTFKEGVNVNWVQLEKALEAKISYEAPLMSHMVRYVSRCQNIHNKMSDSGMSPLDRLREKCESPVPVTWPFGVIGFAKPCHPQRLPYRGKRLVSSVYLGPCASVGSGCVCLPLEGDYENPRQVDEFSAFRPAVPFAWSRAGIEPLAIPRPVRTASDGPRVDDAVESKKGLLKRRRENPEPVSLAEAPDGTQDVELTDIEDLAAEDKPRNLHEDFDDPMYSPSLPPEEDPNQDLPPLELSQTGTADSEKPDFMEVDGSLSEGLESVENFALKFGSLLSEPNDDDTVLKYWWDEQLHAFLSRQDTWQLHDTLGATTAHDGRSFEIMFGGKKLEVLVPVCAWDEITGLRLDRGQLESGLQTEMQALEKLGVGLSLSEVEAVKLAKERGISILSSRWVMTQKTDDICRCRLVVKDFKTKGESALYEGWYSPTSSVEALRIAVAIASQRGYCLGTLDISTAFMFASLDEGDTVLVRLPTNVLHQKQRVVTSLKKAMNGLRKAPLLWFKEVKDCLYEGGFSDTFESTVFRRSEANGDITLVVLYVDDVLIVASSEGVVLGIFELFERRYRVKRTGLLRRDEIGTIKFLGRVVYREHRGGKLRLGLCTNYAESLFAEWPEKLKMSDGLPNLEKLYRETELKEQAELTEDAKSRFRRTLGQLAWMSITRSDLAFPVSFLSRFQSSPNPAAESCLRAVLRWIKSRMTVVQEFPAGESRPEVLQAGCHKVLAYVDSSWSDPSVSGCLVMWFGCLIRSFSRKQEVPALSSPESELMGLVEALKESMSVAILAESVLYGIPMASSGQPANEFSSFAIELYTDNRSAQSIAQMVGLLRRVRHLQLRASFLQYCVQHGLAVVFWIAGVLHGADGLTKTPTKDMLVNLLQTAGFVLVEALQPGDPVYEGPAAVECPDRSVYCEVAQEQQIPDSLEHRSSQLPLVGKKVSFSPDRDTVKEFVAT